MILNRTISIPASMILKSSQRLVLPKDRWIKSSLVVQQARISNEALSKLKSLRRFDRTPHYVNDYHELKEVYSESGTIGGVPKWYRFGLVKVVLNIVFFIGVGAFISKKAVNFLEENDIFKPEEDDEDDDY